MEKPAAHQLDRGPVAPHEPDVVREQARQWCREQDGKHGNDERADRVPPPPRRPGRSQSVKNVVESEGDGVERREDGRREKEDERAVVAAADALRGRSRQPGALVRERNGSHC